MGIYDIYWYMGILFILWEIIMAIWRGHHWDMMRISRGCRSAPLGWILVEHLHFTSQKNGFRSFQYPSNLYEWWEDHANDSLKIPEARTNSETYSNHVFKSTKSVQRSLKHDGTILISSLLVDDMIGSAWMDPPLVQQVGLDLYCLILWS